MNSKEASTLQEKARGTFKRNEEIRKLSSEGQNFAQIARRYSLTRQAVRAIVQKVFNYYGGKKLIL